MKGKIVVLITFFVLAASSTSAQERIAFFPFINMDGKLSLNIWCYNLQDSLTNAIIAKSPDQQSFYIVPSDSIIMLLAEYNIDPNNPQYVSDMWKVAKELKIKKVVTGNFNIQAEKFLINAYVYDVRMKLPYPGAQARDIFKSEEEIYEAIPEIVEKVFPAIAGD